MTRHFVIAFLALSAISVADPGALAQEPAARPAGGRPEVTSLIVEVTMSRALGDKVLSSTPYSLAVVADQRSSLRIGGDVPIPSTTITPASKDDPNSKATAISSYTYRSVGTSIDVTAFSVQNGQFRISITVDDSSIYPPELGPATSKTTGAPGFRSFKGNSSFVLRDGQKQDFAIGVDRVTGEVMRVSVKLTVEK
jgi:hypothetical protein